MLKTSQLLILSFMVLLTSSPAKAYLTVGESSELTAPGSYRAGFEPQAKLSSGGGMNFNGFIDAGVNDSSSYRVLMGTGDTDFYTGFSYKWVPIPDYENQPAVGIRGGLIIGREESDNSMTLRLEPIVSKKMDSEHGLFIPFASFPLMWTSYKSKSQFESQLVAGSEFQNPDWKDFIFSAEIGINAKDSFSYIAGSVSIYLDDVKTRSQTKK